MTSYKILMFTHLITVIPCLFIGTYLLLVQKGTSQHRRIGKVYLALMFFTALISLFIPAHVGSRFLNHFGCIHLFSILTIYTVPTAIIAVKKRKYKFSQTKNDLIVFWSFNYCRCVYACSRKVFAWCIL